MINLAPVRVIGEFRAVFAVVAARARVLGLGEMGRMHGRRGNVPSGGSVAAFAAHRHACGASHVPRRTRPAARSPSCGTADTPDRRAAPWLAAISTRRHVSISATIGSPRRGTSDRRPSRPRRSPLAERPASARRRQLRRGVKSLRPARWWKRLMLAVCCTSSANCPLNSTMRPDQRSADPDAGASSRARNLPLFVAEQSSAGPTSLGLIG